MSLSFSLFVSLSFSFSLNRFIALSVSLFFPLLALRERNERLRKVAANLIRAMCAQIASWCIIGVARTLSVEDGLQDLHSTQGRDPLGGEAQRSTGEKIVEG